MTDLEGRIADVIAEFVRDGGPVRVSEIAAAVQAELVRASTVTTEAELRELAVGTIIMDGDQDIYCRDDHGWYIWGAHDGETVPFLLLAGYLPARVLHRPV